MACVAGFGYDLFSLEFAAAYDTYAETINALKVQGFTGWKDYVHDGFLSWEGPMAQARSWLLREGWKRHGLLDLRPVWDINAA